MTVPQVMFAMFVAVCVVYAVVALRTGRAYYGNTFTRFLYVERHRHPKLFWLLFTFDIAMAVGVGSDLIMGMR